MNRIKKDYVRMVSALCKKKTNLVMMFLIPFILYPFISICFSTTNLVIDQTQVYEQFVIGVDEMDEALIQFIKESENADFEVKQDIQDVHQAIYEQQIDAYLQTDDTWVYYEVITDSNKEKSLQASQKLTEVMEAYQRQLSSQRVDELGGDQQYILSPIETQVTDIAQKESPLNQNMKLLLPLFMTLSMTFIIVLITAKTLSDEQETNTENELHHKEWVISRYLSMITMGICVGIIHLIAFAFSDGFMALQLNMPSSLQDVIFPFSLCILSLSALISAIALLLYKGLKDDRDIIISLLPLSLLIIFFFFLSFDSELSLKIMMMPVGNIIRMMREVLDQNINLSFMLMMVLFNVFYIFILLYGLFKTLEGGNNLMKQQQTSLFKHYPNFINTVLIYLFVWVIWSFVGGYLKINLGMSGLLINELFLAGVVIFSCYRLKYNMKETFTIKLPSILNFLAVIILALGLYGIVISLVLLNSMMSPDLIEISRQISAISFSIDNSWFNSVAIALLVAISEELFFRGFILSGLRKYPIWLAMLISAVSFSFYFMNNEIAMLSAFILGLGLAYVTLKSHSLYPAIFMHFIYNGFTIYLFKHIDQFTTVNQWLETLSWNQLFGITIIFLGILIIGIGGIKIANKKFEFTIPAWLNKLRKEETETNPIEKESEEVEEILPFTYVVKANKEKPVWKRKSMTQAQVNYRYRQRCQAYHRIKRKNID